MMTNTTSDADRQKVDAVADEEAAAMEASDFKRFLALLTDDALFMPPNIHSKAGEELREWLRDFVDRFAVKYQKWTHDETVVEGRLAYHRFEYAWEVTPKAGGETKVGHGKGMHILRRQSGGAWRIAREIWNAIPAP
jgi:ketosteroid isomerase-like protein